MKAKPIYFFDEGDPSDRRLLGGKGAGLCEMTRMGLPVPHGFVITTEACRSYYAAGGSLPQGLMAGVRRSMARLEERTGKTWGSRNNPLLISVRSGAAVSMPGMMDTILNVGLNDSSVEGLAISSGSRRFAWDSYRRLVQLFGKVVFGVDDSLFEAALSEAKRASKVELDSQLDDIALRRLVARYKEIFSSHAGRAFPTDATEQLELAIDAVFRSWRGERAIVYREKNGITEDIADGTAVNVVTMVFGNRGTGSATGVVFTRNPGTGEKRMFGEYLANAQGEDVVAGSRTPKPVSELRKEMPKMHARLEETCKVLEGHFREPQDIEFTIEAGSFYLLQTRSAKMNAAATVKTSVDMVSEGMIGRERAVMRLGAQQLEQLLHPTISAASAREAHHLATGIAASPGAATGVAMFDVGRAVSAAKSGRQVILVREETRPEDVPAFFSSVGILTSKGGKTSHAAVVARGMGRPCIVGASELRIDPASRVCVAGGERIREGDTITIDGNSGAVYAGDVETIAPRVTRDFKTILGWARSFKRLGVRANADTPEAARAARENGAEGIGLCRTERMFNEKDRIGLFVDMIMAETEEKRREILAKLEVLQRNDFAKILRAMDGRPVTIRLLDPPLHEFLPNPAEFGARMARLRKIKAKRKMEAEKAIQRRAVDLSEVNPMMGHRGVRVGVTFPEIYEMQIRAVFEAAISLSRKKVNAVAQIMVPQVGSAAELLHVRAIYDRVSDEVAAKHKVRPRISFGTMIEVVRAALTSGELAKTAEFFSFGTNDLTQATFSFSREDAESKFLPEYIEKGLVSTSPFQSIDEAGVGELMKASARDGRAERDGLEVGICGEHGGDPSSIVFCHNAGLDYVSASPHRIPIALVAAAQAALAEDAAAKGSSARKKRGAAQR
ncbi:MAG: pyruvate, phosphate dikinase [Thaumarchaeota archaeon]|nr:pyruvate, phosphate dikinase [Nitrososphaerota archaeon]MDD9842667.1 pyruvate, phosphate dikinase [Nitrososphaerota archaeon]